MDEEWERLIEAPRDPSLLRAGDREVSPGDCVYLLSPSSFILHTDKFPCAVSVLLETEG